MVTSESSQRLQRLQARYAGALTDKRAALADAWSAFVAAPADTACRRELAAQVHRLCGSAAAYGYVELGQRACAADRLLGGVGVATPDTLVGALHALLDALDQAIAAACVTPASIGDTSSG